MRPFIDFARTMLTLPGHWRVWVVLLMMVNMIVPLFYVATMEGRVVLGAFLFGALFQVAIFSIKGFVRLLGIGHIAWVPLVFWLWARIELAPTSGFFTYWLIATILLNSLSLVIDAIDVARYVRGERKPQLQTPA